MSLDEKFIKLVNQFHGNGLILYVILTTLLSAFLSFMVGFERQIRGKSTSLKTEILLSVGCSLLMTVSIWAVGFADGSFESDAHVGLSYDTSRIAAGVVSGMGFLGAGVIIKDKFSVKGLSTAAVLWICSGIGLACGAGFVFETIAFSIVVVVLALLIDLFNAIVSKKVFSIIVVCDNSYPAIKIINDLAIDNDFQPRSIEIIEVNEKETKILITFPVACKKEFVKFFSNQIVSKTELKIDSKK